MRKPLLMMRTKGLLSPFFGRYVGSRSSHPLAKSIGQAIGSGLVVPEAAPNVALLTNDSVDTLTTEGGDTLIATR